MTDHTDKLEPCPNPWCESHARPERKYLPFIEKCRVSDEWAVSCPVCPMRCPWCDTEDEAVTLWNTRPALSAPSPDPLGEGEEYGVTGNWWGSEGSQADIDVDGLVEEKSIDEIALGCSIMATAIEGKGHPNAALYLRTAAAALTTQRDAIRAEAKNEAFRDAARVAERYHCGMPVVKALYDLIP